MLLIILSIIAQAAPTPEIHSAHWIPGDAPHLVITGRDLWVGSETDSLWSDVDKPGSRKNSISVNGVAGEWDALAGGSGHDCNRGLAYVQRARFASAPIPGAATITLTRSDGQAASYSHFIPVIRSRQSNLSLSGKVRTISTPIVGANGTVLDLMGDTIVPAKDFSGTALVTYGLATVVRNGRLVIPEDHPSSIAACLRATTETMGGHFDSLELYDLRRRGKGIITGSCRMSFFGHLYINAWSSIEREPQQLTEDNCFYQCEFTSPNRAADGGVGNVLHGRRNLVWRCQWHDIDRGPTAASWGSPLDRTTYFECDQYRTGRSHGASEGLLIESTACLQGPATISGGKVTYARRIDDINPALVARPGYVVAIPATGQYSRITTVVIQPAIVTITTERPLPSGEVDIYIGNAITENNFIRCRFTDGKAGLFLFGPSINNAVVQCSFADLQGGIVQWVNRSQGAWSFSLNRTDRHNLFRGVAEPTVDIPNTAAWPRY